MRERDEMDTDDVGRGEEHDVDGNDLEENAGDVEEGSIVNEVAQAGGEQGLESCRSVWSTIVV